MHNGDPCGAGRLQCRLDLLQRDLLGPLLEAHTGVPLAKETRLRHKRFRPPGTVPHIHHHQGYLAPVYRKFSLAMMKVGLGKFLALGRVETDTSDRYAKISRHAPLSRLRMKHPAKIHQGLFYSGLLQLHSDFRGQAAMSPRNS